MVVRSLVLSFFVAVLVGCQHFPEVAVDTTGTGVVVSSEAGSLEVGSTGVDLDNDWFNLSFTFCMNPAGGPSEFFGSWPIVGPVLNQYLDCDVSGG